MLFSVPVGQSLLAFRAPGDQASSEGIKTSTNAPLCNPARSPDTLETAAPALCGQQGQQTHPE